MMEGVNGKNVTANAHVLITIKKSTSPTSLKTFRTPKIHQQL